MVCFTSPNYFWLDGMIKAENHVPLYLPVWTLTELYEENEFLKLGLDNEIIEQRFLLFGGSARYCLTLDGGFYITGAEEIRRKAKSIHSFSAIEDCLEKK
jgi:hypothetical protein